MDCWTGSKYFPRIIETKLISESGVVVDESESVAKKASALLVIFDSNKDYKLSPFNVSIETAKTLFVVANFSFIKEI